MNALTKPQLYLVGAPKAGTSALADFLDQHPQISMYKLKESNFHCHDLDISNKPKTEQQYLSMFSVTPETKLLADGSILSLYSRKAAASIADYVSKPLILIILRNPVDAMYAWYSQMVFVGNEPLRTFQEAINAESERKQGRLIPTYGTVKSCPQLLFYRDIMRYAEQIERYLSIFARDQILIFTFDELKADSMSVYSKILNFLELDPFIPKIQKVNVNKIRRMPWLHHFIKKTFAKPANTILPPKLRSDLIELIDTINSRETNRSELNQELREVLKSECITDIIKLEKIIDKDLSHWYC
ncbi:sulfotransferase domain protein [Lyngbya aestuarii BL J]|uniref:Sulfotransferase domain protein n=1 Tax=Lyngbya aestuarii BL J TaxID=1348334 RepID=U7QGY4_9CYAN|nr:sulfotransferase domain-containing protein [Lyngbya aestuarii]ERT05696.1 sulfotransferase domain protein [Lyngbya aestuarii BL J]